jgi:hypothetical protein
MRLPPLLAAAVASSALAACAGAGSTRTQLAQLLAEAPSDVPPRFLLAGDRLVGAAVPLGPGSLPPAVRTTFDAIAPGGKTTFVGREFGERGDGYRVEKRYENGPVSQARGVLCTAAGDVLERWHSVPIGDVPQHILAAALRETPLIDEARIVSGPQREEYWSFEARDRGGRQFVVRVTLDGRALGRTRRLTASIDAASGT